MPRFRPRILNSVFYLYARSPRSGDIEGPCGSGLIVARPCERIPGEFHAYGVTAYHVAVSRGASIVRVNSRPGTGLPPAVPFEKDPSEWRFLPGSDDLAVVDLTANLRGNLHDVFGAPESDLVTPEFIKRVELGPGDDGFMLGLFTSHHGGERNTPATRFGNISIMADERAPIRQANGVWRPSHVFDIHSRPGYSGSPVWVYRTPANALTGIDQNGNWNLDTTNNVFLRVLGIHSGQFRDRIEARKAPETGTEATEIVEGDELLVPSSMTIIVPAWRISALLDLPEFQETREMREKEHLKKNPNLVQAETVAYRGAAPESHATPDNPSHKEDFMRLVGAAAKSRKQDDQT